MKYKNCFTIKHLIKKISELGARINNENTLRTINRKINLIYNDAILFNLFYKTHDVIDNKKKANFFL